MIKPPLFRKRNTKPATIVPHTERKRDNDPMQQRATFAAEVGRRIQRLRQARGLSLSELAHRAAVGKATLSGLEAGTRNPTLETLYAITAQLEVPLATVLTDPGTPASEAEAVHGAAVSAVLLESFADETVTTELYRLRIRPGRVQVSPAHPRGTVEYLTVFAGRPTCPTSTPPRTAPTCTPACSSGAPSRSRRPTPREPLRLGPVAVRLAPRLRPDRSTHGSPL
jgi:transcriptional regulator with XRE-family HTH domain